MKLSGTPPEEITHAWEDVKAMFNGGTRKRLMNSSPSSSHSHNHGSSHHRMSSPKRLKESPISPPIIQAAAVVAAATNQFPIRPSVNIHPNSNTTTSPSAGDIPLPFSRSFMMDYMWHAQNKHNSFQFPTYAIPWLKRPGSILFNQQSNNSANSESGLCTRSETKSIPFYTNSAFKPVVNNNNQCNTSNNVSNSGVDVVNRVPNESSGSLIGRTNSSTDDDHRSSSDLLGDGDFQRDIVSSDDEMVDIETTEDNCTEYKNNGVNDMVKENEIKCDKDDDIDDLDDVNDCGKAKGLEPCSESFVDLSEEWHGVAFKKEVRIFMFAISS